MNAATESAEAGQAVSEAAGTAPCLEVDGSKVCASLDDDGVLVVRVYPADEVPVVIYAGEALVADGEAGWRPAGRHRKPV